MTTKGFSGGAGTGKTTNLLRELDLHLKQCPLLPGQRVLALTFMHGSRRRLADRLSKSTARRQCECMTIDRFAWEICRRWRTRLRATGGLLPLDLGAGDFDAMCESAGRLLASNDVGKWTATRYPVVIVDEFQDCEAARVAIVQALHGRVRLLIAADDFQNLTISVESPAVTWLRELGVCDELTANHRTSDADLLAAAQALRNGSALVAGSSTSFMIKSVQRAPMAAGYIAKTLWPAAGKNVVLLSPARKSSWVGNVIELVGTKKYGDKKDIGPVAIHWEASPDSVEAETLALLGVAGGDQPVEAAVFGKLDRGPLASRLKRWADHQRRVLGRTQFTAAEVCAQIKRTIHQVRSFGAQSTTGRRAMTIHQAKNREFEVVIILWPFEIRGDAVRLRRLLYNAITRAKRRAIIIVNDPKKDRLRAPPFGISTIAPPVEEPVANPIEPTKLYFAYGSNMWEEQMLRRCPAHKKLGKATLAGFRWIISKRGVANVVVAPGQIVEGTLFRITSADEASLDKHEHVAEGAYRKDSCSVQCGGAGYENVLVYVDPISETGKPRAEYIGRINKGVQDAQLSTAFVDGQIRAFIPSSSTTASKS